MQSLVLRGRKISEDEFGNLCLDDLWQLARGRPSKVPKYWRRSPVVIGLIQELAKKVRISDLKENKLETPIIYSKRGRGNEGTVAHPILAAAYAGYLSPKLEIEVREIWLRYRAGDATLADEILQRATAEENRWAGARALSRGQRVAYTDVLKKHYVQGRGCMECTEAVYVRLLGGKSYQLRASRGLLPLVNVRDNLDIAELSYVMAAEALAAERIEEEHSLGNDQCIGATDQSAAAIRSAIDGDRKNRQRRLPNVG